MLRMLSLCWNQAPVEILKTLLNRKFNIFVTIYYYLLYSSLLLLLIFAILKHKIFLTNSKISDIQYNLYFVNIKCKIRKVRIAIYSF